MISQPDEPLRSCPSPEEIGSWMDGEARAPATWQAHRDSCVACAAVHQSHRLVSEALEPLRRMPADRTERAEPLDRSVRPRRRLAYVASLAASLFGFVAVEVGLGRASALLPGKPDVRDPLGLLHAIASAPSPAQELLHTPEVRLVTDLATSSEVTR